MILDLDIIGVLTLLACALAYTARWLIDRGLDRRPLFAADSAVDILDGPSKDWYRQLNPKAPMPPSADGKIPPDPPWLASFPASPVLAAPVAGPEPEQDDDTVWRRHGIDDDVWARLRAEVTS